MEVVRSSGLKIRALILFPGSPLLNTKISGRSSALSIPFASVKCSICKRGAQLLIAGSHVNSLPFKFKWDAGLYSLMFKNSNLCFQCMNIWSFPSEAHPPFTGWFWSDQCCWVLMVSGPIWTLSGSKSWAPVSWAMLFSLQGVGLRPTGLSGGSKWTDLTTTSYKLFLIRNNSLLPNVLWHYQEGNGKVHFWQQLKSCFYFSFTWSN